MSTLDEQSPPDDPQLELGDLKTRLDEINKIKTFLDTVAHRWEERPEQHDTPRELEQYTLPSGEKVACVLWNDLYHITGTDILRILVSRFQLFGRPIHNLKKFEEGVFSDLRNLKPPNDACLEEPKSSFLDMLFKNGCIRTQKKQKVFYWYRVPHDRLFLDALERDLKREKGRSRLVGDTKETTSTAVAEPALSYTLENLEIERGSSALHEGPCRSQSEQDHTASTPDPSPTHKTSSLQRQAILADKRASIHSMPMTTTEFHPFNESLATDELVINPGRATRSTPTLPVRTALGTVKLFSGSERYKGRKLADDSTEEPLMVTPSCHVKRVKPPVMLSPPSAPVDTHVQHETGFLETSRRSRIFSSPGRLQQDQASSSPEPLAQQDQRNASLQHLKRFFGENLLLGSPSYKSRHRRSVSSAPLISKKAKTVTVLPERPTRSQAFFQTPHCGENEMQAYSLVDLSQRMTQPMIYGEGFGEVRDADASHVDVDGNMFEAFGEVNIGSDSQLMTMPLMHHRPVSMYNLLTSDDQLPDHLEGDTLPQPTLFSVDTSHHVEQPVTMMPIPEMNNFPMVGYHPLKPDTHSLDTMMFDTNLAPVCNCNAYPSIPDGSDPFTLPTWQ